MQRMMVSVCLSFMALSCGITEIGGNSADRPSGGHIWGGMDSAQEGVSGLHTTCYVTALDYQKGYDWRSDQAVGSVKCSLVVYADNVPVMKLPVGDEYEVSSDPDMHRIVDGNLYTDYSTDKETVIKKNGRQLFRYLGRESICGFEIIGHDIYTLGQSREGPGFSFRKNGEAVVSREDGYVMGGLVNSGDSLCFAFYEQIKTSDGHVGRYYASVGGKVSQIAVRDDIVNIWDALVLRDKVIYIASLVGIPTPVVFDGKSMISLSIPVGATVVSCRFCPSGESYIIETLCRYSNGKGANVLYHNGKVAVAFSGDVTVSALTMYDGGIFCAMNPVSSNDAGSIYCSGETYQMPEGYNVMGDDCVNVIDGIMHVGLSSIEGKCPIIWRDGHIDSLKINGYLSTIYFRESEEISLPTQ